MPQTSPQRSGETAALQSFKPLHSISGLFYGRPKRPTQHFIIATPLPCMALLSLVWVMVNHILRILNGILYK